MAGREVARVEVVLRHVAHVVEARGDGQGQDVSRRVEADPGEPARRGALLGDPAELVVPGVLPLALVVERMTSGATLLDLPVPRIAPDEPANLTLVDLAAEWEVGEDGYESRSENCCFAGHRLRGRVLLTVAGGSVAHRERALVAV